MGWIIMGSLINIKDLQKQKIENEIEQNKIEDAINKMIEAGVITKMDSIINRTYLKLIFTRYIWRHKETKIDNNLKALEKSKSYFFIL